MSVHTRRLLITGPLFNILWKEKYLMWNRSKYRLCSGNLIQSYNEIGNSIALLNRTIWQT